MFTITYYNLIAVFFVKTKKCAQHKEYIDFPSFWKNHHFSYEKLYFLHELILTNLKKYENNEKYFLLI